MKPSRIKYTHLGKKKEANDTTSCPNLEMPACTQSCDVESEGDSLRWLMQVMQGTGSAFNIKRLLRTSETSLHSLVIVEINETKDECHGIIEWNTIKS